MRIALRTSFRSDQHMARLAALALSLALLLAASASAQTVTRGSDFTAPANVSIGCEGLVQQDFNSGLFLLLPYDGQSCTWWGAGLPASPTDPRTGFVPTTGTVTKVRVKSGPNPAPLRIVQLRSAAGCCSGVRMTEPFQPTPNAVTEVTVNWLVEVVRDSVAGVSTNDIIGFSAQAGTGTLPLNDQGAQTHQPAAAFSPGVYSSSMTKPMIQPGALIGLNYRGAIGYEPLVQYDFVPCPALNNVPIAPGTETCPAQNTPPPPAGAQAAPTAPPAQPAPTVSRIPGAMDVATAIARLRDGRLSLRLLCQQTTLCQGRMRIRTRGANGRTIASVPIRIAAGQAATVKPKISAANRRLLRRKAQTPLTVVLDLGAGKKVTDTLTFKR
jgi:hypothetical protein